jgi:hypothetical protein
MNTRKPKREPTELRPKRGKRARKTSSVLRVKPVRDPDYLFWIREWPCVACWPHIWGTLDMQAILDARTLKLRENDPMHTGPHGISQKASDHTAVPGCREHHTELDHQLGKAFWKKYGLNRTKIIAALRAQYLAERPENVPAKTKRRVVKASGYAAETKGTK